MKKWTNLHTIIKRYLSENINLGKKAKFQKPVNITMAFSQSGFNATFDETSEKSTPEVYLSLVLFCLSEKNYQFYKNQPT